MPDLRLSVALITRNRPSSLMRALESLRAQSIQPFEAIVSDDSDNGDAACVRKIACDFGCRYVAGPRRGIYANRNNVFLACQGTHIRTMDDDHVLPPGHLKLCHDAASSDPNSIWTTGEKFYVNDVLLRTAPTADQLHPAGVGCTVSNPNDNWAISDGSSIYPRKIFEQGHRMVEEFAYGPSYLEFGVYLYRLGFKSRCVPGALVEHYADESTLNRVRAPAPADIQAQMFAIFCFNLYFQPNRIKLVRHLVPLLKFWRFAPSLAAKIPKTYRLAARRYKGARCDA